MTRLVLFIACVAWASSATAQHANRDVDWLAALPLCAMGNDVFDGSGTKLLYPRPGLAALVYGGQLLVTRVRLPAPLTPPPGHQQEKALRGWSVELLGRGVVYGGEHRYALRVSDVRPDARAGLVYRATVPIPPWVAPGTYDIRIKAPGTPDHVVSVASLRVLNPGEAPRIGRIVTAPGAGDLEALGRLPVDIWFSEASSPALVSPLRGGGIPWVDLDQAAAILRTREHALVLGECDDPLMPFDDLRRVHTAERAELEVPRAVGDFVAGGGPHHFGVEGFAATDGGFFLGDGAEVSVVFREGMALDVDGSADVSFWPGTPPRRAGHRASVVARIRGNGAVGVREVPAQPFAAEPRVPSTVIAGQPFSLQVDGEGPIGVAWSWEEDGAFYAYGSDPASVDITLRQMRRQVLRLWAVSHRGEVLRRASVVVVETERPAASCAVGRSGPMMPWIFGALWGLWYGSRRLRRQQSPDRGNKSGNLTRSESRTHE